LGGECAFAVVEAGEVDVTSEGTERGDDFFLAAGTGVKVIACLSEVNFGDETIRVAGPLRERKKLPPNFDSASSTSDNCILEPNVGVPHREDERSINFRSSCLLQWRIAQGVSSFDLSGDLWKAKEGSRYEAAFEPW